MASETQFTNSFRSIANIILRNPIQIVHLEIYAVKKEHVDILTKILEDYAKKE